MAITGNASGSEHSTGDGPWQVSEKGAAGRVSGVSGCRIMLPAMLLQPRDNDLRDSRRLDGRWRFRPDAAGTGFTERWWQEPLRNTIPMAVPASWNDQTQDAALRDLVGWAWYETTAWVPAGWTGKALWIRFDAVAHRCVVWIDGVEAGRHEGGFMPFALPLAAAPGRELRITVAVDSRLDWRSLPPGEVHVAADAQHPAGDTTQFTQFDFFNYAGIHRPVRLVAVPPRHITGWTADSRIGPDGVATVTVAMTASAGTADGTVVLTGDDGIEHRAGIRAGAATVHLPSPRLWHPDHPHLYRIDLRLEEGSAAVDRYIHRIGVREIRVDGARILLNGAPFHFRGFGKHEDADVRGRGYDEVLNVKDAALMRWMGANSFRTSHYPYAEEWLDLADELGFAVISETAAVGLCPFGPDGTSFQAFSPGRADDVFLAIHERAMCDLVARDRNHACVVMWSVANEPACWEPGARPYFARLMAACRPLDPSRPWTLVQHGAPEKSVLNDLVDLVCVNRYQSWYSDPGRLDLIERQLVADLTAWHQASGGKPVFVTEYGADAVAGLHSDPPVMFSEEYQAAMLERFHAAFDRLSFMVGEHVWAFADFATKQGITRVMGNRKGVLTRSRQPKLAAQVLRRRWTAAG